jgi:hypothetical protein
VEKIVVELPAHHKALAEAVLAASAQLTKAEASAQGGRAVDMKAIEVGAAEAAAKLERAMLRQVLLRLDVDADRVIIGGRLHVRVGRYAMVYYSMAGALDPVARSLFRPVGERNGPTVDPIAVRAGLVGGAWLPAAAQAMAQRLAIGTSREAAATSELERRLPYSRTSFEEVGHLVGEAVVSQREDIEQRLVDEMVTPEGTRSIGVALDRAAMAFEEPRPRRRGRPRKDAPKRPISRVFHMAWSGTVTFNDAEGTVLHTLHYGREPAQGEALVETLVADVLAIRDRHPDLPIVLLCDGAHELWSKLESALAGVPNVTSTLDFWHLAEKLGAAASVVATDAKATLSRWKLALLNRSRAGELIAAELQASGKEHVTVGKNQPVHEALTYLANHRDRLTYKANRRRGLPIGSGPVEANVKSIYFVRINRPGARWKPRTADHILQLRAHLLSSRFADAVNLALPRPQVVRKAA